MTDELRPLRFEQFIADRRADFKRIARRTRGDHDTDDLISEAWCLALDIGKRRGYPVDFGHPAECDQVLAWLYKRTVDFVRGKLKQSLDDDGDDALPSWHERLAAPSQFDPLQHLLRAAEEHSEGLPTKGFSQYSAYMILLKRCEMNVHQLADYLAVTFQTLRNRIEGASGHADRQPSLFDFTESIDPTFVTRLSWMRRLWECWQGTTSGFDRWLSARRAPRLINREEFTVTMAQLI